MSGKLTLVRHGESEWNALGKWTGKTDVSITSEGARLSEELGRKLSDISFDVAYSSTLKRAKETLDVVLKGAGQEDVEKIENGAINERDYGVFTGKKKEEVREEIGEEAYLELRRGWDRPIEDGESLKDVYARTIPYYLEEMLPRLESGENVLVVAHGNSLRALVKYLEGASDEDISTVEVGHNLALVYEVDQDGRQVKKQTISL